MMLKRKIQSVGTGPSISIYFHWPHSACLTACPGLEVSAVADEISAVKVIAPAVHDSIQPNVQPAVAAPSSALDQMLNFQVAWKR